MAFYQFPHFSLTYIIYNFGTNEKLKIKRRVYNEWQKVRKTKVRIFVLEEALGGVVS